MKEMQAFLTGYKIQFDSYVPGPLEIILGLALLGYILYRLFNSYSRKAGLHSRRSKALSHTAFSKKILHLVKWPEKEIPILMKFLEEQGIQSILDLFAWTPWDSGELPLRLRESHGEDARTLLKHIQEYVAECKKAQGQALLSLRGAIEQEGVTLERFEFCPVSKKHLFLGVPDPMVSRISELFQKRASPGFENYQFSRLWKTFRGTYVQCTAVVDRYAAMKDDS